MLVVQTSETLRFFRACNKTQDLVQRSSRLVRRTVDLIKRKPRGMLKVLRTITLKASQGAGIKAGATVLARIRAEQEAAARDAVEWQAEHGLKPSKEGHWSQWRDLAAAYNEA